MTVSFDDFRYVPRGAVSRMGTPGSTAWPWLCPHMGGTACEIVEDREWADRRLEAWFGEVHRYPTIQACREEVPAATADLILLNRPEWDADGGARMGLRACAEFLRPGGHAILMLSNRRFRSSRPTARSLGFSRLRLYLCTDGARYADSVVPHDRTALYAHERLGGPRGLRGKLRLGAVAVGLGSRLYPWILVIAER